ncbi:MAG: cobB [Myxococcaceae bacterium]|nr:cobB [Myxococcaceae bacterium]
MPDPLPSSLAPPSGRFEIPRLLIAGVSSNVGKTTVTVALARALSSRGLRVAVFKCGPDYLDPTYHRRASGRASHNLDGWMMGRDAVLETFLEATRDADIALIEGVMGLFDGVGPESNEGSSAEIASWLAAPVLLVLHAAGMARSVAALAHGFASFDPQLSLAGLFCNRVGSAGHLALIEKACFETPVLGGMLAETTHQFASRHLGLHDADEAVSDADLDAWSERLLAHTDLDRVLAIASAAPPIEYDVRAPGADVGRCRIGIARDEAFSFYYPYNLRLLERLGAELVPFSPLRDQGLPDVDGLYIGGGYPELHAEQLSQNAAMRAALHAFAARGRPIYAECGGLMFLSDAIVTLDQQRFEMMGLVPGQAVMQSRLSALGYVEVQTREPGMLGEAGTSFRGHQFRYSRFDSQLEPQNFLVRTRRNGNVHEEGYGTGSVLASYVHAHWASNPAVAAGFVHACAS